jgi:hypothetical protein
MTPLRFRGKPVWIGQVNRDIGVRFTPRIWNLTMHRIDPDVDDVLDDLMEAGRVALVGYVVGVGAGGRKAPRRNLAGDPYITDGLRAVAVFSNTRTTPAFLNGVLRIIGCGQCAEDAQSRERRGIDFHARAEQRRQQWDRARKQSQF